MGRQARNWPRLHAPGRHLFHASLAACGHGLRRLPAALSANVCVCTFLELSGLNTTQLRLTA